jgi:hypothetical protein
VDFSKFSMPEDKSPIYYSKYVERSYLGFFSLHKPEMTECFNLTMSFCKDEVNTILKETDCSLRTEASSLSE